MAGGGDRNSRWLITYGDLVTLLLAFFIALYAISRADSNKFNQLLRGLGPFGNPAAAGRGVLDGGPGFQGSGGADDQKAASGQSSFEDEGAKPTRGNAAVDGEANAAVPETVVGAADLPRVRDAIAKALAAAGVDRREVDIVIGTRGLSVALATDAVVFAENHATLTPEGVAILRAVARGLRGVANDILVEGHTDNQGRTNWRLSTDRAVAVVEVLSRSGVAPERLAAAGYAEFRPVASNATEAGRRANRRVEIWITMEGADGSDGG